MACHKDFCIRDVNWIDVKSDLEYCDLHADGMTEAAQEDLRHVYFGEPYLDPTDNAGQGVAGND